MNPAQSLDFLKKLFCDSYEIAQPILEDERFQVWSGSSEPYRHHYGDHGLIIHTAEVVALCLANNELLNCNIDIQKLKCAALYHDFGKIFDYQKVDNVWKEAKHKHEIHHVSRSAIVWNENAKKCGFDQEFIDDVLHAILSHHGLKEWGSPVSPKTKLAWMLHLCDSISARMNDNGSQK